MRRSPHLLTISLLVVPAFAAAESVTIHRDDWGIPHIFAETEEGACYALGYAQAEDRLEELLKQYRRATGTMSEAFGPGHLRHDFRQRLWRHAHVAEQKYATLGDKPRALIEAFQQGIKDYMAAHPDEVPTWAPDIEPWMCVALYRYIIWGWPEGDAGGDMQRAGIEPDPLAYRGSNQWVVAPQRTAYNAPIALIDPHLGWYGQFRFYEVRMYGGKLEASGVAILGSPLPSLGHNRYCSVAMTTGGPDAADCYVVETDPNNPQRYRYDGGWREMSVRTEVIKIKEGDDLRERPIEFEATHHGPVVARKDGKAYALKLPYADQVGLVDQTYQMLLARNLAEMKDAIRPLQLMEQNLMIATTEGDIFYVRYGRVPIRKPGYDYKRPLPGDTPRTEWQGFHRLEELVQLENPPQGYMQNCNVSPQFITKDCPLVADIWADRPYLFNGFYGMDRRYDNPLHQRAAMCLELLNATKEMTVEQAISIALNAQVYGANVWQAKLKKAWADAPDGLRGNERVAQLVRLILGWDGHARADSVGAIAYHYWKQQLGPDVLRADRAGFPPPPVTDERLLTRLEPAVEKLLADHGRLDVAYGDVYRVGRQGTGRTWPASGGSVQGIATPRAIGFNEVDGTNQHLGRGGQTATQIVLLTDPPKSWTALPLGQSDHPVSPHYDDQCEKLFSQNKMKPTYFLDKDELAKHVTAKVVLEFH